MAKNSEVAIAAELLEVQRTLGWMDLVIGNITDAVYVTDHNERLVFVNQCFSDIVGVPRVFLLGQTVAEAFPTSLKYDPNNQFLPNLGTPNDTEGSDTNIYERVENEKLKIYKISCRFIPTIEQTVHIAKDITTEYEMSVMKNDFINIASHQLRTPMTAIMTYSHMLYQGYGGQLDADQKQLAERIVVSSERMISLINDILLISRLQNGEENLQNKDGSFKDVFNILESELESKLSEKKIKFKTSYPEGIEKVKCNKFLIHEILSNLLINGIQYTPSGGKLAMKAVTEEKKVKIIITDNGIGIPKEDIPNIFNQFTRADNAFKAFNEGTGLGLYVVKIIADLINAKIDCSSRLNKGTTFTVAFPL